MALHLPTTYGSTDNHTSNGVGPHHHRNSVTISVMGPLSSFEEDISGQTADSPNIGSGGSSLLALFSSAKKSVNIPSSMPGTIRRWMSSRRFLLALVALMALITIVATSLLIVSELRLNREVEDNEFLNQIISWRDKCERRCQPKIPFDVPPLLVISMDGFHSGYLERDLTPAVSRILNCGAKADYLLPSYPSKTFPNHYSIVTGLYPEAHGIVDNSFYDASLPEKRFSKASVDERWYRGEPIWNTVMRNGGKSAVFFWPGSEVPIGGMHVDYRYVYNSTTPFSRRVDQVGRRTLYEKWEG